MLLATTITVRFANVLDAALIADLSRHTFYQSFASGNTRENMDKFMNEQFTRDALMAELEAPGNFFLLASYRGAPAGYARLREDNNPPQLAGLPTLEIARIYALKELIGQGIGKALMTRSIDFAKEKKKQLIWLGVWEKNLRAIEFYTRWGFEKFAEHPFILGDDVQTDWLMKKKIEY
jgi:ribosomal protein S18 acetylase RimI-like enzyme